MIAAFCLARFTSAETAFNPSDFGRVNLTTSANSTLTFSLTGLGAAPAFSLLYGTEFSIGSASCDAGFTTCTLPATFIPKYPGVRRDLVVVRDGSNNVLGRMILTGTGNGAQTAIAPGTASAMSPISTGGFWGPGGFVIDPGGNIYTFGSYNSNQVFKISATNGSTTIIALSVALNKPSSLALDPSGNLYIADSGNNVIRKMDAVTGVISTVVGNGTQGYAGDNGQATAAEISGPYGLTFDPSGNLYFLEYPSDYKVHKVDAVTQVMSVFAGTGISGNTGDNGPALQAKISPLSLGIDPNGNVLIAQAGVHDTGLAGSIRLVSGGIISTFAGSESGTSGDGAPAASTSFFALNSISVDAAGNTYLADGTTCCMGIRKLAASPPHVVSTIFHSDSIWVRSLARDAAGNFYASDEFSWAEKISVDTAQLSLPSINAGQTSAALTLSYYNTGNDTLNIAGMSFGGSNPEDFAQTNDCGASLPSGGSCTISVTFNPQAMGGRSAVLTITDNALGSPHQVALSGTGLTPQQAVLSPSSLNFGQQTAGIVSAPQTVTLSNPGIAALTISSITTSDPAFAATSNCGSKLAAGAQCTISVTFSPRLNGFTSYVYLTVTDDASNSPQSVSLNGFGVGATSAASVSTTYLNLGLANITDFGARQVAQSKQKAITITSTGTGNLGSISYYTFSGANASEFSVSNNCTAPMAPGASCTLLFTFTPAGPGLRTASLQIFAYPGATAAAGLPQTVALAGTGFLQTNAIRGGPGYLRVSADFDGDGKADFAVWRPANGTWYVKPTASPSVPITQQWGLPGDVPVPGDYDGDGKADFAVWRPDNGTWYIIPSSHPLAPIIRQWGLPGDIPLVGDFDGDHRADLSVWRQSTGTWYVLPSANTNSPIVRQWGLPGDIPLVGDFDGDGRADFAVWRPSSGNWYIIPSSTSSPVVQQWGLNGDTPVAVDFDGDGKTDYAIWRPLTGTWWVIPSRTPSAPVSRQWGLPGDVPVPGDYDGDGKADYAVWRPSSGCWYLIPSSSPSAPVVQRWGDLQDVILAGDFSGFGRTTLASWHPATGMWTIPPDIDSSTTVTQQWGSPGDIPLLGDFDGDGKADFVVWRPSNGTWYIRPTMNPASPIVQQWGLPGDIPLVGDFDGDRKADFIVWRPSNGTWYILPSSNPSTPIVQQWGLPGDIPLVGNYFDYLPYGYAPNLVVWRPSNGTWYILPHDRSSPPTIVQWGLPGDIPLMAYLPLSYATQSIIVWRPSNANWYALTYNHPPFNGAVNFVTGGVPGDVPLAYSTYIWGWGNVNILALWHPVTGALTISSSPSYTASQIGTPTDMPL